MSVQINNTTTIQGINSNASFRVATRSALSAVTSPAAGMIRHLTESGREGIFKFDSSNLSTKVTADPSQGIYVAPSSDTTGASGAWVRQYESRISVKWFGAKGDGTTNDGAAFDAMNAFFAAIAINTGSALYKAGPRFYMPYGHYYLGTHTQDITYGGIWEGDGTSEDPAGFGSTLLRWDDGVCGIRVQFPNTYGTTGYDAGASRPSPGLIVLRDFSLKGGHTNTSTADSHAIVVRGQCYLENLLIRNWSGNGVHTVASVTAGIGGNASLNRYIAIKCENVRIGFYTSGSDVNVIHFESCDAYQCHQAGFVDENGAGANTYVTCHVTYCGWTGMGLSPPLVTKVSYSGKRYYVKAGQETWCAANAPSGTTDHNTGWLYLGTGGVDGDFPAWTNGMSNLTYGGDYVTLPNCWNAVFLNCYAEGGGFGQFLNSLRTQIIGGTSIPYYYGGSRWHSNYDRMNLFQTGSVSLGLGSDGFYYDLIANNPDISLDFAGLEFYRGGAAWLRCQDTYGLHLTTGANTAANTLNAVVNSAGLLVTRGGLGFSSSAGISNPGGVGGAVTQATDKSTAVTLNKSCGRITTHNQSLAAGAVAYFTVNNSQVDQYDTVRVNIQSGNATPGTYRAWAEGVASGSFKICVENRSGGSLSEALVLNFSVIKGTNA